MPNDNDDHPLGRICGVMRCQTAGCGASWTVREHTDRSDLDELLSLHSRVHALEAMARRRHA